MKTCIILAFKGGKKEKIWESDCETAAREAEENRRRCGSHNPCSIAVALASPLVTDVVQGDSCQGK